MIYATLADFKRLEPSTAIGRTDPELTAAVDAAERELDLILGPFPAVLTGPAAGFKIDPAVLLAHELEALKRATCAQAAYALARGAARDAAPVKSVKGPDFEKVYADRAAGQSGRYSPRLDAELGPLRPRLAYSARARP